MKSYFAGQCGAALGAVVGAVVAMGVNEVRGGNPHSVFSEDYARYQNNENTIAVACVTIGAAIGGLTAIFAVNK